METRHTNSWTTVFILLVLVLMAQPALAKTWYVKCEEGYTGGDGSAATPYASITAAIGKASTGHTVFVLAGSDCREEVRINQSIHLRGETPYSAKVTSGSDTIVVTASNTEISGLHISAARYGIILGNSIQNIYIHNNIITETQTGIKTDTNNSTTITNNLFSYSNNGIEFTHIRNPNYYSKTSITSNIFYKLSIAIQGHGGNYALISHNIFSMVNGGDFSQHNNNNSPYTAQYNLYTDPLFVDPDIGNYQLKPGSPGIDAGPPVASMLDPDGTRNDIGVYGGPGAAGFWPYAGGAGPVVTDLAVSNVTVAERDQDGNPTKLTLKLRATGEIRR